MITYMHKYWVILLSAQTDYNRWAQVEYYNLNPNLENSGCYSYALTTQPSPWVKVQD